MDQKRAAHGVVPSTATGRGSHIKSNSSPQNISNGKENVNKKFSRRKDSEAEGQESLWESQQASARIEEKCEPWPNKRYTPVGADGGVFS